MAAAPSFDRAVAALEQDLSCSQMATWFGVGPAIASRWRARPSTHGSLVAEPMSEDRRSAGLEEHASVPLDLTLAELKGPPVPARDHDVAQRDRTAVHPPRPGL